MRGLDGRRRKTLTILTGRVSRIPPLLGEVMLLVHLGGSGVRRVHVSHRERGILIGGILHHGHVVGLGGRTRGKMLRVEHIVR